MAYVGNPIDTQNTFQSLVGKRFNGDGSTTAFTLDVAPSSTLDLEVFVGNVRQDPNSAYTVSGTTLTFTGAPPSGTNNIYVVHQAKSVGTITPGANSVGVTELNLSDGSSGQAITTDGSGTISFSTISTSLTGIDDQSSSNDDQLTITDTAVVINEDSDDVDFRVESNGNANMLHVSGGNDIVGIGNEGDLGNGLHIKIADTSAGVSNDADEFVIEGTTNIGMTFATANDSVCSINFSDPQDNDVGQITYDHNNNRMLFVVDADEFLRIASNGEVSINEGSLDTAGIIFKVSGAQNNTVARIIHKNTNNSPETLFDFRDGDIQACGSIGINAGTNSVSFNTSSDYRLKENESAISDGITRIKQLKPYRFNWIKDTTDTKVDGFFAHEVSSIVPEAIVGEKDGYEKYREHQERPADKNVGDFKLDEKGEKIPEYQQIDQSKLVPLLTAALQEAITEIESLKARVTTLEG